MAACGSIQHIFENPLPDNQTLLETLSSWNQIMPVKPIEQSSFTEIFGELHFKESFVPSFPDSSTPPTSENIETIQGDEKNVPSNEQLSNGESSNLHRRSHSFSSSNSESLQYCTEGLGFESLDDVEDLKGEMDEEIWQRQEEEVNFKKHFQCRSLKPEKIRRSRSANMEDFPPPISCMGKSGKPWVGFKSYRYDGRFILKEIRVPTHEFLHARRENGRLKLHILVPNEKTEDEEEDLVVEEEQEEEDDDDDEE